MNSSQINLYFKMKYYIIEFGRVFIKNLEIGCLSTVAKKISVGNIQKDVNLFSDQY